MGNSPITPLVAGITLSAAAVSCQADDQCAPQRLVAPASPFSGSFFGGAVAIADGDWFVGHSGAATAAGVSVGKVHVYGVVDGELAVRQTLDSPDPFVANVFGRTVTPVNDQVVIGAIGMRWPGRSDRPGGLFVYERADGLWERTASIEPLADSDDVGRWVTASNDRIATRDEPPLRLPRVLVYERTSEGWEFAQAIETPDGLDLDDAFGVGLAMGGQWLAISAYRDGSLVTVGGSVWLYRLGPDGRYEPFQTIIGDEEGGQLGVSMAIDGDDLFVGAFGADRQEDGQGVVYHYRFDGSAWTQVDELVASPPRFGAQFGVEMSLNDDTLIVGAHLDVSGGRRTGIAYVFEPDPAGRWRQIARLAPESPFRVDGFGAAVASDGERALVGAFAERDASDSRAGAAYFFDLSCTACAADMDFDGDLTLFDYLAFFNAFDAADPIADLDGDGEFTLLDFVAFQDAFDAGCD